MVIVSKYAKDSLVSGVSLERVIQIGKDRTISFLGEDLRVYETPSMIADIEYACRDLLVDHLLTDWDSVGVEVNIKHLAATPINESVLVHVSIQDIQEKCVRFDCQVSDSQEIVGRGTHDRYIINVDQHRSRIQKKHQTMRQNPKSLRTPTPDSD